MILTVGYLEVANRLSGKAVKKIYIQLVFIKDDRPIASMFDVAILQGKIRFQQTFQTPILFVVFISFL